MSTPVHYDEAVQRYFDEFARVVGAAMDTLDNDNLPSRVRVARLRFHIKDANMAYELLKNRLIELNDWTEDTDEKIMELADLGDNL